MSADIFTTKQNLEKHSTVQFISNLMPYIAEKPRAKRLMIPMGRMPALPDLDFDGFKVLGQRPIRKGSFYPYWLPDVVFGNFHQTLSRKKSFILKTTCFLISESPFAVITSLLHWFIICYSCLYDGVYCISIFERTKVVVEALSIFSKKNLSLSHTHTNINFLEEMLIFISSSSIKSLWRQA